MLDVELHRQDIQDLHNADAVAAFFAKLRYDTNARLTQKPANLGIVESLHSQIRHCERIAALKAGQPKSASGGLRCRVPL